MTEQYIPNIGREPAGDAPRDAIHFAVAPVVAWTRLQPGQHVGTGDGAPAIGIVDPFLTEPVAKGGRFWLFLYPGTITGLRHEWTHPAFAGASAIDKAASEAWLREFCDSGSAVDYDTLINVLNADGFEVREGEYYGARLGEDSFHVRGRDAHGSIPAEFWTHAQIVTGRAVPERFRAPYFSCSC